MRRAAGAAVTAVLVAGGLAVRPAVSVVPGSNGKIAFESENQIYVMKPDGSGTVKLSDGEGLDRNPAWSPDGTRITFAGTTPEDRLLEIFVMDADGTDIVNVSNNPDTRDLGPDWQALPADRAADLSVSLADAPDPAIAGKELTYTVEVVNDGPAPSAATLVDRLPGTAAFVGASSGCGYDEPSHTVHHRPADVREHSCQSRWRALR